MRGVITPLRGGPFSVTIPDTAGLLDVPNAGGGAIFLDTFMPWLINVSVDMTAISHVNWDTNTVQLGSVYRLLKSSSGAQNDEINFDVSLAAGTWTFELIHAKGTNYGIITIQLDGSTIGTIDSYAASASINDRTQITGVAVVNSGKKRLKLLMATKNASSTNYVGAIHHLQFKRTA